MKQLFIIVILIIITNLNSLGQVERKTKTKIHEPFKEKFTVLKEDKKVKDGTYNLFYEKDTLVSGYYKNNDKDSNWTYYNSIGEIEIIYNYTNNHLVYWNKNAKVDFVRWTKQDFDLSGTRRIIMWSNFFPVDSSFLEKKHIVYINGKETKSELDRPPLFIEGSFKLQMELSSILKEMNIDWKIYSQCLISFKIDENGITSDYKIEQTSDMDYETEFLQLLEKKSLEWIPGELNGEPVTCKYMIPISTVVEINKNRSRSDFSFLAFKEITFLNYINLLNLEKEDYIFILWSDFTNF